MEHTAKWPHSESYKISNNIKEWNHTEEYGRMKVEIINSELNKGKYKQGEKTAFWVGENNSKWSNWQTTNLKNLQATPAAQFQKNKWPNGPKN